MWDHKTTVGKNVKADFPFSRLGRKAIPIAMVSMSEPLPLLANDDSIQIASAVSREQKQNCPLFTKSGSKRIQYDSNKSMKTSI